MKTMSAARKIDYSEYMKEGRTVRQALLKWMLAQPNIDTISLTMRSFEDIDEFVAVSGDPKLSSRESRALEGYCRRLDKDYCRPGCDGCLGACPQGVLIHDIMRYRLYFNNYGREKYAMRRYASLPASQNARQCSSCSGPCRGACPYGVSIQDKLTQAHDELTV
jgi:predicted aldo/keto reductase-like oxidoreductase